MIVMGLFASALTMQAHPYEAIEKRNAFGLKPAPPPSKAVEVSALKPDTKITLTGMALLNGKEQLFLRLDVPGETEPRYLQLVENERYGEIEVTEIDLKRDQAWIQHQDQSVLLTFETHGAKTATPRPEKRVIQKTVEGLRR